MLYICLLPEVQTTGYLESVCEKMSVSNATRCFFCYQRSKPLVSRGCIWRTASPSIMLSDVCLLPEIQTTGYLEAVCSKFTNKLFRGCLPKKALSYWRDLLLNCLRAVPCNCTYYLLYRGCLYTVRKKALILRSIERRPQMQFSMARKFPLWPLRRYDVKHSNLRKFTFVRHGRRKPKNTAWARTNILWVWSPPLCHCAILIWDLGEFLKYIFFFFVNFLCLRNIPHQCIQNARICFI
jgi:hypothetical protein